MSKPQEPSTPVAPVELFFDDIAELGRAIDWDIDFRQLDSVRPSISAQVVQSERLTAMRFAFSNAYHQRGFAPRSALTFGIPGEGPLDWYARGVDGDSVLNFNDAQGFDCVSPAGFSGITLSVSSEFIDRASTCLGIAAADSVVSASSAVVVGDRTVARRLRASLAGLIRSRTLEERDACEWEVVALLLAAAQRDAEPRARLLPAQRVRAISRAIDYIEAHPDGAVRVGEICDEIGVSWRTLDRAFRERFGVGPKAYVHRRRLTAVRAALTRQRGAVRVADVANAWGFWHMGQFARDYRRTFGELPSETAGQR
ncbi:MAG: helix-turn-helix domain-containing protein [Myxococcota bacterium]